ncbi:ribonuclease H-like domain-containing protein [Tanacetum coccineum]
MNCHVTTTSPLLRSHTHALRDPNWHKVMLDEYNALITNGMWVLVSRPANVNVVCSMWLFKHKFHADGFLRRYKARLVANGRSQQLCIDCDKNFSPLLCMALSRPLELGFSALLAWRHVLVFSIVKPTCLCLSFDVVLVLLICYYMRMILYLVPPLQHLYRALLLYFKSKFSEEILERAHMQHCNPCRTPVDTDSKFGPDGDPVSNPALYRRFTALKRILRYVRGTLDHGLQLHVSSTTHLTPYTNADWASYFVPIYAEAEYHGVANVVAETAWIRNLLRELHASLFTATIVYCDNVRAGQVRVLHVSSRFQYADIFTKGLPSALFFDFRSSLNVRRPPVPTAGEY